MEKLESARSIGCGAARLRHIATSETKRLAELRALSDEIEEDAAPVERSFRDNAPLAANHEHVA